MAMRPHSELNVLHCFQSRDAQKGSYFGQTKGGIANYQNIKIVEIP